MSFNGWVLIFSCLLSVPFLSFSTVFFLSCSVACNGVSLFDNEIVILNLFQNLFYQNSYSLSSLTLLASQLRKERKQLNKKYFICSQGFRNKFGMTLYIRFCIILNLFVYYFIKINSKKVMVCMLYCLYYNCFKRV